MTIKYLKKGKMIMIKHWKMQVLVKQLKTLKMIKEGGDKAVELSEKFDNYSPKSFKLSLSEINDLIDKVPARDLEDINLLKNKLEILPSSARLNARY